MNETGGADGGGVVTLWLPILTGTSAEWLAVACKAGRWRRNQRMRKRKEPPSLRDASSEAESEVLASRNAKASASPISTLPLDLLALILQLIPQRRRVRVLTLVCQRWLSAVLRNITHLKLPSRPVTLPPASVGYFTSRAGKRARKTASSVLSTASFAGH